MAEINDDDNDDDDDDDDTFIYSSIQSSITMCLIIYTML